MSDALREWIVREGDLLHLMSVRLGAAYTHVPDAATRLGIPARPLSAHPVQEPPVDVEAMLVACVPGGSSCDPQPVADDIREWFAARAASQAQEPRGCPTPGEEERVSGLGMALMCLALEVGHLSEGQMSRLLNLDRVTLRKARDEAAQSGLLLAGAIAAAMPREE